MPTKNERKQFLEPVTVREFIIAANDFGTKGGGGAHEKAKLVIRELPLAKRSELVLLASSWKHRCGILASEMFSKLKDGQVIDCLSKLASGSWPEVEFPAGEHLMLDAGSSQPPSKKAKKAKIGKTQKSVSRVSEAQIS
jgi:hypothetical protein